MSINGYEHKWYCGNCKYDFTTIDKVEKRTKKEPCPLCKNKYTIETNVKKID
jgi:hypothetical protein